MVADYRSSDGTPDVARLMGARVLDIDKPGVGYASHVAILESRGDIVIRTDADTIFPPSLVGYIVSKLTSNPHTLVATVGHVYYDGTLFDNLMAYYFDKYWRQPWNTTGHFISIKKSELLEKGLNFNPKLKFDDDYDFGRRVYETCGSKVFFYDYFTVCLVSARRIRTTGLLEYILGFRKR